MRVRALSDVFLGLFGGFRARSEVFDYNGPQNRHLAPVPVEIQLSAQPQGPSVPLPRPLSPAEQEMAEMGALAPGLKKAVPLLPPGYVPDATLPPPPRTQPAQDPLAALAQASATALPTVSSVRLPETAAPVSGIDLIG